MTFFKSAIVLILSTMVFASCRQTTEPHFKNISTSCAILEDTLGVLTIDEVASPAFDKQFRPVRDQILHFPANSSYFWIKIDIGRSRTQDQLLVVDEAHIDRIDLFFKSDHGDWQIKSNGTSVSADKKEIANNVQVFGIPNGQVEIIPVYLKLQPSGLSMPLYLTTERFFHQNYDPISKLSHGIVIGIIFFIAIANIFLFLFSRDLLRLLYSVIGITFVIYLLAYNGYLLFLSSYLYGETVGFVATLSFIVHFLLLVYGYHFLRIKKRNKTLQTVWNAGLAICLLLVLAKLILICPDYIWISLSGLSGTLSLFICLIGGTAMLFRSSATDRPVFLIYTASYVLFLLFVLLELGHLHGGIPHVFFIKYLDLGFLCESIGLMMAINKQNAIDKHRIETERQKAILERNSILEEQVSRRTEELLGKTKIAENLTAELRESNTLKDRLLSILAHDLKSPLTQLQGLITLSEKAFTRDELNHLLGQIEKQVNRTIGLLNTLLLWAQSQSSGFNIKNTPINLFDLAQRKLAYFEGDASQKKINMINAVPGKLLVRTDPDIISLLLHNLVFNAIKFSSDGDSVTVTAQYDNQNRLIISVSDTGIGMTKEELDLVLGNSLYTKTGTATEQGTGLGLKICKDMIAKMGGRIYGSSSVGEGTTFELVIPNASSV